MKPVIAIPKLGPGLLRLYFACKYTCKLHQAGARVRWLDLSDPTKAATEATACDGLLIPGGNDVSPALYGRQPEPDCGKPNKTRDTADPVIIRHFLKTGKPILGICRGLQVLNVTLGGTLQQHIVPFQQVQHQDFRHHHQSTHTVSIEEGSLLYPIVGKDTLDVNSYHHQALADVAQGLTVIARSPDGFVEAAQLQNHPFCLGVQWHPELMSDAYPDQQKILCAFVNACKGI